MKFHLTATDLFNYAKCQHRPTMDFYGDVLERVQGLRPQYGYIYKNKSRKLLVDLSKKNDAYEQALQNLIRARDSDVALTKPALSSNCKMCEWKNACKKSIKDNNDCTQVYYVGAAMQQGLNRLAAIELQPQGYLPLFGV